jgi:hypothetical protein
MRKVAAAMHAAKPIHHDMFNPMSASKSNAGMMHTGNAGSAVGNTLAGGMMDGSGVSCITFEQHSSIVRYPNSMSNLRRLRCYLLACQVGFILHSQHNTIRLIAKI